MPVRLDGTTSDYLQFSNTGLPSTTAYTVTWWMQVVNAGSGDRYFFDVYDAAVNNRHFVYKPSTSRDSLVSKVGGSTNFVELDTSGSETDWEMWAVTCSGTGATDLKAYHWKLGDPDGTYGSAAQPGCSFTILEWLLGGVYFATGRDARLCFVKMWDAALSLSELQAERVQGKPVRTSSVNRYHRLETSSDTSDGSGNGRTISINGAVTEGSEPVPWEASQLLLHRPRQTIFVPRITLG